MTLLMILPQSYSFTKGIQNKTENNKLKKMYRNNSVRTCPCTHIREESSLPYEPNRRADIGFSTSKLKTKEPSLYTRISPGIQGSRSVLYDGVCVVEYEDRGGEGMCGRQESRK